MEGQSVRLPAKVDTTYTDVGCDIFGGGSHLIRGDYDDGVDGSC